MCVFVCPMARLRRIFRLFIFEHEHLLSVFESIGSIDRNFCIWRRKTNVMKFNRIEGQRVYRNENETVKIYVNTNRTMRITNITNTQNSISGRLMKCHSLSIHWKLEHRSLLTVEHLKVTRRGRNVLVWCGAIWMEQNVKIWRKINIWFWWSNRWKKAN